MYPTLRIGSLSLQVPGLIIIIGIYLGLSLMERRLPGGKFNANIVYNLSFLGLAVGFIAARILFILEHVDQFLLSPPSAISLDSSLLDPVGGAAAAGIAIFFYGWRKKLPFWSTLDVFTPLMAVFLVALGLAHVSSGKAFGIPTSLPWGIYLWGDLRHPTQVYETITALVILAILWRRFRIFIEPGKTFLLFITLSAGMRILLETWRGDSPLVFGGIRLAQVIAWIVLAVGLFFLERRIFVYQNNK